MDVQTETALTFLDRLGPEQGKKLKDIAATSMRSHLSGMKYRPRARDPLLKEKAGVYVTLKKGKEVRGISGFIYPTYELWNSTRMAAVNAAFMDARFRPVERREVDLLDIEVSVIGQVEKLRLNSARDLSTLEIGTDGVMVVGMNTSAVMLPQVAIEMDLGPEAFMGAACESAGLSSDAWMGKYVSIYRFSTRIF